ncbi:hypothetical protein [Lentibacillus sp. Marseille-P4043]|uniref:hypothetical protein n=1 Tax=Lentibacillus sp. Marseille-P4043 TaxID=2040293 RepID=UPI00131A5FA6|nr:hypothetical protein [Lentibacillus sp. Marseille-P4043]
MSIAYGGIRWPTSNWIREAEATVQKRTIKSADEHRPENENIGPRTRTSAREREHRPENENIGPRTRTSAREREHRPENENIGPIKENTPRP